MSSDTQFSLRLCQLTAVCVQFRPCPAYAVAHLSCLEPIDSCGCWKAVAFPFSSSYKDTDLKLVVKLLLVLSGPGMLAVNSDRKGRCKGVNRKLLSYRAGSDGTVRRNGGNSDKSGESYLQLTVLSTFLLKQGDANA